MEDIIPDFWGLDPEHIRHLEEQFRRAQELNERARSVNKGIAQNESTRRAIQSAIRAREQHSKTWYATMTSQSVQRSIEAVLRTVNSPDFRRQLEGISRAVKLATDRLGPEGLSSAATIAPRYLESTQVFEPSYEQAVEKIQAGRADEVLGEVVELVSRPEILEAVELADKAALTEEAKSLPQQEASEFIEVRAGIDVETVIASAGSLSEEDIQAMEYLAFQVLRLLTIVASVAIVATVDSDPEQFGAAVAGVYAFLDFLVAVRKFRRGSE